MNEENKQLNPVEEQIRLLIFKVGAASVFLAVASLLIGAFTWKSLWMGIPLGLIVGYASFFVLAQTVNSLSAPTKIKAVLMVFLSSAKLLILLLVLWALYKLGLNMVELLIGLFMSQVAIFTGIVLTFHRGRQKPPEA